MAPDAVDGGVVFGLPGPFVDGAAAPTIFKGEVGRVGHVEGDHVIVHVAAEVDGDRNAAIFFEVLSAVATFDFSFPVPSLFLPLHRVRREES